MAHVELATDVRPSLPGLHLDWITSILLRPRATFEKLLAQDNGIWLLPLTILSASAVILVLVMAHTASTTATVVDPTLPPNFEYYPPQSQEQFMQAIEVTNGFTFRYLFPAILAAARVWLGWIIVASSLHFVLTLLGGRGSNRSVLNLTAWAGLPFVIRDLVRIAYIGLTQQTIDFPGLSGFAPVETTGFPGSGITAFLGLIDIYWLWHVILLVLAVKTYRDMAPRKVLAAVTIVQVFALLIQCIPGLLGQSMANLSLIQPFFF